MRIPSRVVSLLIAVVLTGGAGLVAAPTAQAQSTVEARFVERINAARARHNLPPLRVRSGLTDYARRHSAAMSSSRTLFHTRSFSAICCWSSVAENVGVGYTVRGVHRAFMSSPAHRANILDASKRHVGVGVVRSGGRIWVTEIFRTPS